MELHLNLVEALWLAASGVASYFTSLNYLESKAKKDALYPLRNGRLIVVNGNLRRDFLRLVMLGSMISVGIFAAFRPGEVSNPLGVILLMVLPLLLAIDSAADTQDRRTILRYKVEEVVLETQDQREDREFGEQRRSLEDEHNEAKNADAASRSR